MDHFPRHHQSLLTARTRLDPSAQEFGTPCLKMEEDAGGALELIAGAEIFSGPLVNR